MQIQATFNPRPKGDRHGQDFYVYIFIDWWQECFCIANNLIIACQLIICVEYYKLYPSDLACFGTTSMHVFSTYLLTAIW